MVVEGLGPTVVCHGDSQPSSGGLCGPGLWLRYLRRGPRGGPLPRGERRLQMQPLEGPLRAHSLDFSRDALEPRHGDAEWTVPGAASRKEVMGLRRRRVVRQRTNVPDADPWLWDSHRDRSVVSLFTGAPVGASSDV